MEKEEILNNLTYFSRCVKLLNFNYPTQKKEIREVTEDTLNSITLNNLLKFLEENNFVQVDRSRVPHEFHFDVHRIAVFLRDSDFFKQFGRIIEITKPNTYNY